jgi:hypothetical protein
MLNEVKHLGRSPGYIRPSGPAKMLHFVQHNVLMFINKR